MDWIQVLDCYKTGKQSEINSKMVTQAHELLGIFFAYDIYHKKRYVNTV